MKQLIVLISVLALPLAAQQPDNTKVNQRDRAQTAVTADQQGNSKEDVERTTAIRKAIGEQKDLSTYAHNVKVITLQGHVTLRGPVRDQHERDLIGQLATHVAGAQHVTNALEIARKQDNSKEE